MKEKIESYLKEINETTIDGFANKIEGIEQFRIKFLGKKGVMNDLFEAFKGISGRGIVSHVKLQMGIGLGVERIQQLCEPILAGIVDRQQDRNGLNLHGAPPSLKWTERRKNPPSLKHTKLLYHEEEEKATDF